MSTSAEGGTIAQAVLVRRDPDGRIAGLDVVLGATSLHLYDAREPSAQVHLFVVGGDIAIDNPGGDVRIQTADCELIVRARGSGTWQPSS